MCNCVEAAHKQTESIRINDSHLTLICFILPLVILILFQCWLPGLTIGKFLSTDMLKTQVASLKTSTCVSCLAASVSRQTSSNTWKSQHYEYIFLPVSIPSRRPPPNCTVSFQNQLPITLSWKAAPTQSLFVSDSFLSLCAHVRTVLDPVCLCVLCVCSVLIGAGTRGNDNGSV